MNQGKYSMEGKRFQSRLALFHLPGMNTRIFHALAGVFVDPADILDLEPESLRRGGLPSELAAGVGEYRRGDGRSSIHAAVARDLAWHRLPGHEILVWGDEHYPPLLSAIPDPPPLLYVEGCLQALFAPQVAVVGSRNASPAGRRLARRFARSLCENGFTVTSGLAQGIDREGHLGALEVGGGTVAVLGTGIDRVFPERNRQLAGDIVMGGGALVSEFPLGKPPLPHHFPQRNRIISGLSLGVLVVEAATRSGSLITARLALDQGREVFAVPGVAGNPLSRGCHRLIRQGAKLAESVDDILEELPALKQQGGEKPRRGTKAAGGCQAPYDQSAGQPACLRQGYRRQVGTAVLTSRHPGLGTEPGPDLIQGPAPVCSKPGEEPHELNEFARRVLAEIGFDTVSVDALAEATGMPIRELSAALIELEIGGKIRGVPGGFTLAEEGRAR